MAKVPRLEPGYLRNESLQHYQNSQLAPSYAYYKQDQALFYVVQKNIYQKSKHYGMALPVYRQFTVWRQSNSTKADYWCNIQHLRYSVVIIHFRIMKVLASNLSLGTNQSKNYCYHYYYYYYYYYRYGCLLSQGFSSWYFSWTSGDPHRSGFKLHTAVLSALCV